MHPQAPKSLRFISSTRSMFLSSRKWRTPRYPKHRTPWRFPNEPNSSMDISTLGRRSPGQQLDWPDYFIQTSLGVTPRFISSTRSMFWSSHKSKRRGTRTSEPQRGSQPHLNTVMDTDTCGEAAPDRPKISLSVAKRKGREGQLSSEQEARPNRFFGSWTARSPDHPKATDLLLTQRLAS